MISERLERTALLLGEEGIEKLADASVCIFGIGGVGGYVCEALARSGVGHFTLIDNDIVSVSNINRQIIATTDTVGMPKVKVMQERILQINPDAKVEAIQAFYLPENRAEYNFGNFDYIVDCIDTVTAKIDIVIAAKEADVPVISSMGTGNKLNPARLEVADIYKTSVCPLARVMRTELKKRGVKSLKVVYSKEEPIKVSAIAEEGSKRRSIPGSTAFVPATAGLIIASEIIKDLTGR
ncbi:MAG: ThiF family adenylyltransferase [Lachnospiraceae bacterium]